MNILFLLLCFHSIHQSISSSNQKCKCSKVKPDNTEEWEKQHSKRRHRRLRRNAQGEDNDSDDDRIVGGYATKQNKPWAAKLWDFQNKQLCGASLINKRYVLTAAHCTCQTHICVKGKPMYQPAKVFKVYLGLNNLIVDFENTEVAGKTKYEYGVEDVIPHPDYKTKQDIALVKLNREVKFIDGVIEPICLPKVFDKSDIPKGDERLNVYVAGWGNMTTKCTTNELGPWKNKKCLASFTYKGKKQSDCMNSRSPSSKDDVCKKFKKANKSDYPKKQGEAVLITDGKKNTTCYAYDAGEFGWCKGTESDKNWGWCGLSCNKDLKLADQLQETQLQVLPLSHCKTLITNHGDGGYEFIGRFEMCAGRKKSFKKIKVFEADGSKYKSKGSTIDYIGLNEDGSYKYNYYVSGTDSCNGDSGGALYRWIEGVPTMIAVVSRGWGSLGEDGCAELNYPGIYTRTSKYIDWIKENTKDGSC